MGKCGHCGFEIHPAESGVRSFGTYRAHSEYRCRDHFRNRIADLEAQLAAANARADAAERETIERCAKVAEGLSFDKAECAWFVQPAIVGTIRTLASGALNASPDQ